VAGDLGFCLRGILGEKVLQALDLSEEPLAMGLAVKASGRVRGGGEFGFGGGDFLLDRGELVPHGFGGSAVGEEPDEVRGLLLEAGDLGGEFLWRAALVAECAFDGFVERDGHAVDARGSDGGSELVDDGALE
jgi:hypothetical protein